MMIAAALPSPAEARDLITHGWIGFDALLALIFGGLGMAALVSLSFQVRTLISELRASRASGVQAARDERGEREGLAGASRDERIGMAARYDHLAEAVLAQSKETIEQGRQFSNVVQDIAAKQTTELALERTERQVMCAQHKAHDEASLRAMDRVCATLDTIAKKINGGDHAT